MRRVARVLATLTVVGAGLVVGSQPASAAAVTVTSSGGSSVTVAITGDGDVSFPCDGGVFTANHTVASPSIACAAVTTINVSGDVGNQHVDPRTGSASFPNVALFAMNLGGGNDRYEDSPWPDLTIMGPGSDWITFYEGGAANFSADLGTGTDGATFTGTPLDDTITATSSGSSLSVVMANGGGSWTRAVANADVASIEGGDGDDTIDSTGVVPGTSLGELDLSLQGGPGDDVLTSGAKGAQLFGQSGTNELNGGPDRDELWSESVTDVLRSGGGNDYLMDANSLHVGGRVIVNPPGDNDYYYPGMGKGDGVVRTRPAAGGGAKVTVSLQHDGQQVLPAGVVHIGVGTFAPGQPADRAMGDYVALAGQTQYFIGDGDDLLDITVPSGSWTITGTPANGSASFTGGLETITFSGVGGAKLAVHAPWTDKRQGFAHRVIRDLLFRIPGASERDGIRDDLADGSRTRAGVVASFIATDGYRGLDVDRAFLTFLERASDATGRTYWIGRVRTGLPLWSLRAQLLGSSEFFSTFGQGTNEGFVRAAYRRVLGREPDAGGLDYWVGQISSGTSRASVAITFLRTAEARGAVVTDQYLRFLDRVPTPTEASTWTATLASSSTGEQELIATLAGSSAYFDRT